MSKPTEQSCLNVCLAVLMHIVLTKKETKQYMLKAYCLPKSYFFHTQNVVVFRTELHKMKIKHRIIGEYAMKRCFFDLRKLTIVTGS